MYGEPEEWIVIVADSRERRTIVKEEPPGPARRFGYLVAAVLNGVLLFVVNNLLGWELLPFLTEDFSRVLGILNLSLLAGMLANVMWIWLDPVWFKSPTQIALNVISLVVAVRMYRVFPFDFSPYDFPWETLVRVSLWIGGVGLVIGTVVELANLARWAVRRTGG